MCHYRCKDLQNRHWFKKARWFLRRGKCGFQFSMKPLLRDSHLHMYIGVKKLMCAFMKSCDYCMLFLTVNFVFSFELFLFMYVCDMLFARDQSRNV